MSEKSGKSVTYGDDLAALLHSLFDKNIVYLRQSLNRVLSESAIVDRKQVEEDVVSLIGTLNRIETEAYLSRQVQDAHETLTQIGRAIDSFEKRRETYSYGDKEILRLPGFMIIDDALGKATDLLTKTYGMRKEDLSVELQTRLPRKGRYLG